MTAQDILIYVNAALYVAICYMLLRYYFYSICEYIYDRIARAPI